MARYEDEQRKLAVQILKRVKSSDLSRICDMYRLKKGGSTQDKVDRILDLGLESYERTVRRARLVILGYQLELYQIKGNLKEILIRSDLPIGGNMHELYMRLVENDRVSVEELLRIIGTQGIREIYKSLFQKPPIGHEIELKREIVQWIDFRLPKKPVEPARPKTFPGNLVTPRSLRQMPVADLPESGHDVWPIYGPPVQPEKEDHPDGIIQEEKQVSRESKVEHAPQSHAAALTILFGTATLFVGVLLGMLGIDYDLVTSAACATGASVLLVFLVLVMKHRF